MSIQDLGAIGEFVSAIIIVVTLVYLAAQSRQNQKLLRSSAFQARATTLLELYREVATSPDLAKLLTKSESGEELTADERMRFQNYQQFFLKSGENVHFQVELGVIDDDYLATLGGLRQAFDNVPHMRETWEATKHQFRRPYRDYIDEILESPT